MRSLVMHILKRIQAYTGETSLHYPLFKMITGYPGLPPTKVPPAVSRVSKANIVQFHASLSWWGRSVGGR